MKKSILAICDKDEGYARRLMEKINDRDSFPFEVSVFTDADIFYRKLTSGMVELGIISESMYSPRMNSERLIAILDEGEGASISLPLIWKYQSAEKIRKAILEVLSNTKGISTELIKGGKTTSIISFFSPVRRCLQSTMALSVSQELAKSRNVLFISMESFSGITDILDIPEGNDITDLMYYYKKWRDKAALRLEGLVNQRMGFDIVSPADSYEDLSGIEVEDWIGLLDFLKNSSTYDYVILDLQEGIRGIAKILCKSRYVFTIVENDVLSKYKLEHYKKWLGENDEQNILDKTEFIELPKLEEKYEDNFGCDRRELAISVKECVGKL